MLFNWWCGVVWLVMWCCLSVDVMFLDWLCDVVRLVMWSRCRLMWYYLARWRFCCLLMWCWFLMMCWCMCDVLFLLPVYSCTHGHSYVCTGATYFTPTYYWVILLWWCWCLRDGVALLEPCFLLCSAVAHVSSFITQLILIIIKTKIVAIHSYWHTQLLKTNKAWSSIERKPWRALLIVLSGMILDPALRLSCWHR